MEEFYIYKLIKTTFIIDHYQLNTFRTYTQILSIYFNIFFFHSWLKLLKFILLTQRSTILILIFTLNTVQKDIFSIINKEKYYLAYLNEAYTVYNRVQ